MYGFGNHALKSGATGLFHQIEFRIIQGAMNTAAQAATTNTGRSLRSRQNTQTTANGTLNARVYLTA